MAPKTRNKLVLLMTRMLILSLILVVGLAPLWPIEPGLAQGSGPGPGRDGQPPQPPAGAGQFGKPQGQLFQTYDQAVTAITQQRNGTITAVIQLAEPPALEVAPDAAPSAARDAQVARVEGRQRAVQASMDALALDYDVLYTTSLVYSSVVVQIDRAALPALNALPGVVRAYEDQVGTLDNATSVPFIGAPDAWAAGYTGQGVKVAIIDSGVDYNHANFGCTIPGGGPKYAGGYDFVGNSWVPNGPLAPDADPMDQNGHGSHVAGTALGCGVDGTGSAFTGPYDLTTPFGSMVIGPGVAPEAELYALKVGSAADAVSSAATVAALEWAVLNGMDIVNLSLGRDFGGASDGWTIAANNAAQAGIVVVSSAGNSGDTFYIQGSPSNAEWALSVAASTDADGLGLEVNSPANIAGTYAAGYAEFAPMYNVTGDLVLVDDGVGSTQDGCQMPFTNAAALVGKIALLQRGNCAFAVKALNAQNSGAIGVVLYNNTTGTITMGGTPSQPVLIPMVSVSAADGASFIANIAAPVNVTFPRVASGSTPADRITSFSSRGPGRGGAPNAIGLKPDISAPGEAILSTMLGTANGGMVRGGTSMASPHVAGTMALLRQQHPGWSVSELKALVMNTALHDLTNGTNTYDPARAGVGRVDALLATGSFSTQALPQEVIAFNAADPEQVSVSFGVVNVDAVTSISKTITVRNKGSVSASYDLSYVGINDLSGGQVRFDVSPASITVGANSEQMVTVTLNTGVPNAWSLPHSRALTVVDAQAGFYRHWLAEESGYVVLAATADATTDLRVPVYASPRPASTLSAAVNPVATTGFTGTATSPLAGQGIYTGTNYPYDLVSALSVYELQYVGTDETGPPSIGDYNAADIEYIGVTANYAEAGGNVDNAAVFFGISTFGEWDTLNGTQFQIYVDANRDGSNDYVAYNTSIFSNNVPTDAFYVYTYNINTNAYSRQFAVNYWPANGPGYDFYLYNNNVVNLPVRANSTNGIGLTNGAAAFNYFVATYHNGTLVEVSPQLTYDVENQMMDFSGYTAPTQNGLYGNMLYGWPGYTIDVDYDWTQYTGTDQPCALVLHHLNIPGTRAEQLCFTTNITYNLAVGKAVDVPVAEEGDTITYTVTAKNKDTFDNPFVVVNDVLPEGVTHLSNTPSQGTYDLQTGVWDVGLLTAAGTAGDTAKLIIKAVVNGGTAGQTIVNTASIEATVGTEINPVDNVRSAQIVVASDALAAGAGGFGVFDPAMSKLGELQPGGLGLPGEQVTWTITVTNQGAVAGTNFVVVDDVRPELRIDDAENERGTVSVDGQRVTFTVDYLGPGESVTLRLVTTVLTNPLDGEIVNEAVLYPAADVTDDTVTAEGRVHAAATLPATGYPLSDAPPDPTKLWLAFAVALLSVAVIVRFVAVRRQA